MLWLLSGSPLFTCCILLLQYSVLCTVESLSLLYGIVSSKIYDKRDDFNFEMVYIFLSLFVLLECALMLMTSTTETYF